MMADSLFHVRSYSGFQQTVGYLSVVLATALMTAFGAGCRGERAESAVSASPTPTGAAAVVPDMPSAVKPAEVGYANTTSTAPDNRSTARVGDATVSQQQSTDKAEVSSSAGQQPSTGPFNLFAPPKLDIPVVRQNADRQDNEPIRLVGFIHVDRLRALLVFEGKLRAMEVGETYKDVEVVSIEPPKITLRRGNERWITALFDQPLVHESSSGGPLSRGSPQVTVGAAGVPKPSHIVPLFQSQRRTGTPAQRFPSNSFDPSGPIGLPSGPAEQPPQPPGFEELKLPELPQLPPLPGAQPSR